MQNRIESFFRLKELNTNPRTEIIASLFILRFIYLKAL